MLINVRVSLDRDLVLPGHTRFWHDAPSNINNCYQDYGVRNAADLQRLLMDDGAERISV